MPSKQLMQLYKIAVFAGADQFLQHVAHVRGKLRRGGTPDLVSAAKVGLQVRARGHLEAAGLRCMLRALVPSQGAPSGCGLEVYVAGPGAELGGT